MSLRTMHENNKKNIINSSEQTQSSSMDELLSLIQELSSKNQELFSTNQQLSIKNLELTEMIQELHSDKQILKSKIVQQAELIEKLNESDLELKKAEELQNRLKEKEKHWQNEVKRSQEEASLSERRANTAILQANSEKEKAENKKAEYDKLIASEKKLTEKRAEQLNDQFRKQWQWIMLILITYGGLATLFTGYKSERVVSDCVGAFNAVGNVIMMIFNWINNISEKAANSVGVPDVVVLIIVSVVIFGVIGLLIFFGGRVIINTYQNYCYDEISLFVVLISIAVLVWFADYMPINVILLFILANIVYVGVRWYIKGYKEHH